MLGASAEGGRMSRAGERTGSGGQGAALEVVRRVVAADNGRDLGAYRALLHDDYTAVVNGAVAHRSGDAEARALARYWEAFPDGRIEEQQVIAQGGAVVLRYRLRGTQTGPLDGRPPTGRRADVEGCTILEVEDGRVRRVHRFLDALTLLGQLGLAPGS
jgi:steroid delta-isomerase-like uncharacterized protein